MRYELPQRFTKTEAEAAFADGVVRQICDALIGLSLYEDDWKWVQDKALQFLDHPNSEVRMVAATALGHLARLHRRIEKQVVVPALRALLADPAVGGRASDALDDIEIFLPEAGSQK